MADLAQPAVMIFVGMMGAFVMTLGTLTIRQALKD